MKQLSNTQKQFLRRSAHELRPLVQIGKNGLTEKIYAALEHELDAHELVKVKFMDFREEKRELAEEFAAQTDSALVGIIGNIAIVYRQQPDPEKRKIHLPQQ